MVRSGLIMEHNNNFFDQTSIHVIKFSGRKLNWNGFFEKFLAKVEFKGCQKLLLWKKNKVGYDKVPIASKIKVIELKNELDCSKEDKNILQVTKFNQQAYMELILSITHKTASDDAAFGMVKSCKTSKYLEGKCKMAWDQMVTKYAPKTEKEFENSKLENVKKIQKIESVIWKGWELKLN